MTLFVLNVIILDPNMTVLEKFGRSIWIFRAFHLATILSVKQPNTDRDCCWI